MVTLRKLSILAFAALMVTGISGISAVFGDSSIPVNYTGADFTPVSTTVSYNYDFVTGALIPGTATATALVINNALLTVISDPTPPDPANGATFFGTAKPEHLTPLFTNNQFVLPLRLPQPLVLRPEHSLSEAS